MNVYVVREHGRGNIGLFLMYARPKTTMDSAFFCQCSRVDRMRINPVKGIFLLNRFCIKMSYFSAYLLLFTTLKLNFDQENFKNSIFALVVLYSIILILG